MTNQSKKIALTTCLWFDKNAEEAANFYAKTFPDSRVTRVLKSPSDYPSGKAGQVITVEFTVLGQSFVGLNGGPAHYGFSEAVSFVVNCETQEEVDKFWDALADGGEEGPCGWLKDRFGLSWQITPTALPRLLTDPDREKANRAMNAMMGMKKLDIAELERAAAGEEVPA